MTTSTSEDQKVEQFNIYLFSLQHKKKQVKYRESDLIISNWLRTSKISIKNNGWIEDFETIIWCYCSCSEHLIRKKMKLSVYTSVRNWKDQKVLLIDCKTQSSVNWFDNQYLNKYHNPLIYKSDKGGDLCYIGKIGIQELKQMGLSINQSLYVSTDKYHQILLKTDMHTCGCTAILLDNENIFSWNLNAFQSLQFPSQILYDHYVGLICVDYTHFMKCEHMKLSDYTSNGTQWNEFSSPITKIRSYNDLSSAIICHLPDEYNGNNRRGLLTYSEHSNTAFYDFNDQTWINLPDNKINIHGQWSTMYQWKRKNDGNVLVINGVNSVLGFHKLVSKFDMHKQEWFKLPDTLCFLCLNISPRKKFIFNFIDANCFRYLVANPKSFHILHCQQRYTIPCSAYYLFSKIVMK
ncbi:hypothetical protein RFI_31508 [Reticulomyxa filosa]|uniref:Uncharacterized protein n=1 Tax=Reticulomyxa filosa TaxID=46433 RepID=X6LVG3_RETFI|nr:hypothetical protein RFI_31508 [Reticulomyxa filosa]|eukprot:ETO05888.1 hypothetical protein RFI_31508 [Reticulomyxa filosa]